MQIISEINPSTPHSLTVWTDEMVLQAMHAYASQVAEAVDVYSGDLNTERIKQYRLLHEQYNISESTVRDIFCKGIDWYKSQLHQPYSSHQQNGSPAPDGWVRVEDGQENGESSICQHDFVLKYMDYEKCAKCGQEKQYAPTVGGAVWVICAANYYDDGIKHEHQPKNISNGFVTCGRRHHNCISTFAQIVGFPYSPEAEKIRNTEVQGFITNTNMFVDRKEALIIATQAKQLIHDVKLDSNIGLTSEDIY